MFPSPIARNAATRLSEIKVRKEWSVCIAQQHDEG